MRSASDDVRHDDERGARGVDRGVDVFGRRERDLLRDPAGRGIEHVTPARRRSLDELAVDPVGDEGKLGVRHPLSLAATVPDSLYKTPNRREQAAHMRHTHAGSSVGVRR